MGAAKNKNQLRRERAKKKRSETPAAAAPEPQPPTVTAPTATAPAPRQEPTAASLEQPTTSDLGAEFEQFRSVFARFGPAPGATSKPVSSPTTPTNDPDTTPPAEPAPLSRRQERLRSKIPLAELKRKAANPQMVDWYDADAPDPLLLIRLKCLPNAVPVPSHWQTKRDYLAGKRAIDKPPFQLPKYILDTGIQDMRDTTLNEAASLRQQARERVQPRMGRLDMDYAKLYNAFFKFQEKPRMSAYGEVYFEGKNTLGQAAAGEGSLVIHQKQSLADLRPGSLSKALRHALGMPPTKASGKNTASVAPWMSTLERLGPPPAYPYMRLPNREGSVGDQGDHMVYRAATRNRNTTPLLYVWGQIEQDGDDDGFEPPTYASAPKHSEQEDRRNTAGLQAPPTTSTPTQPMDRPVGEVGSVGTKRPVEDDPDTPKTLYTVVKEVQVDGAQGLGTHAYDLPEDQRLFKRHQPSAPAAAPPAAKPEEEFEF